MSWECPWCGRSKSECTSDDKCNYDHWGDVETPAPPKTITNFSVRLGGALGKPLMLEVAVGGTRHDDTPWGDRFKIPDIDASPRTMELLVPAVAELIARIQVQAATSPPCPACHGVDAASCGHCNGTGYDPTS